MVLPSPEEQLSLPLKTQVAIITLQQVYLICRGPMPAEDILPAANRAKELMDRFVAMLGGDQRYLAELKFIIDAINLVANFDNDQVETVGGLLYRVPLFIEAALPRLLALE